MCGEMMETSGSTNFWDDPDVQQCRRCGYEWDFTPQENTNGIKASFRVLQKGDKAGST